MSNRLGPLMDLLAWCKRKWRTIECHQAWLAEQLGWTLRTTQRWIAAAKACGRLRVTFRYRRTAVYQIITPAENGGESGGTKLKPKAPYVGVPSAPLALQSVPEQHHRDDDASPLAEAVRKAAGIERLSEGDRRYLRELERSGVTAEAARAGVLVGRARRAVHASNGGSREPIRSIRYFAGPIAEAQAGSFSASYVDRLPGWLERAQRIA